MLSLSTSCSVAPASLNARPDDGGKLTPFQAVGATVHHCPAWQQGEFFEHFFARRVAFCAKIIRSHKPD